MVGWDRIPLPTLTVSRIGDVTADIAVNGPPLQLTQTSKEVSKVTGSSCRCPVRKPVVKHTSIEETLSIRSGLRDTIRSRSSPSLLRSDKVCSPQPLLALQSQPDMSEMPRTFTPTPLHVPLGGFERKDPWAAVLCGKQRLDFPARAVHCRTDENVIWYKRRELEKRCASQSAESREKDSTSTDSLMPLRWSLLEGSNLSACGASPFGRTAPCSFLGRSSGASPTSQKMPAALLPKIEDGGWARLYEVSGWAEQARALASLRVNSTAEPSVERDHALHERLKLLDVLERKGVAQGVEALRSALCFRFRDLNQAFTYIDVAETGCGPSMLEMSGSLALLGFDAPSLCGCSDLQLFLRLDVDRDGRIGLEDLLGTSTAPTVQHTRPESRSFRNTHVVGRSGSIISEIAQDMDTWSNDEDAVLDPDGRDRWALIAKFIALSSWFHVPPKIRQRGRPSKKDLTCGRTSKHQPATPLVRAPGLGEIGHGPARGTDRLSLLQFKKVNSSVVPDGWRLATHTEVMACQSEILLLMTDWDVCGLAGGWRFDGASYGHNLKEPCGQVEFSMIIVCQEDVHNIDSCPGSVSPNATSMESVSPRKPESAPGPTGELAKQQALDVLRLCWSPNEAEFEDTQRVLQRHFIANASVRQLGEPLMSRKDVDLFLGRLPPPGLEAAPFNRAPSSLVRRASTHEIYDQIIDMQVVLSSLKGKTLSKGLTFDSFRVFLQRLSLALGLHFRHLVDDAFEYHAESAGCVV